MVKNLVTKALVEHHEKTIITEIVKNSFESTIFATDKNFLKESVSLLKSKNVYKLIASMNLIYLLMRFINVTNNF